MYCYCCYRFFKRSHLCRLSRSLRALEVFWRSPCCWAGNLARCLARACADLARRMPCQNLIFNRSRLCYRGLPRNQQPRQLTEYQNESAYSKSRTSLVIGFIKMFKVEATCPAVTSSPLPTTLLSITLEPALTTSLEHSLRSPLRALARDRKGVRFLSDQAFANHPPSIIKRTHQKEQRSYDIILHYTMTILYDILLHTQKGYNYH